MTSVAYDLDALRALSRAGTRFKFLFFWGHTARQGEHGKECFSQWYPAPFEVAGTRFASTEHFMMHGKAKLFGDEETAARILAAPSPAAVKALGRAVRGFDEEIWRRKRMAIVVAGNHAKFSQNAALAEFLLSTGECVLVEASPVDRIWGIGLAADDPHSENPLEWRGLNLLGFALMIVRERLRAERI